VASKKASFGSVASVTVYFIPGGRALRPFFHLRPSGTGGQG